MLGKACVDRNGKIWGEAKRAKDPQKKMQWWGTWSGIAVLWTGRGGRGRLCNPEQSRMGDHPSALGHRRPGWKSQLCHLHPCAFQLVA